MSWNNDGARGQLIRAVLIHKEIHGVQETIAQLSEELRRLTMLREIKRNNAEIIRLTKRVTDLEMRLSVASQALEYYADTDIYVQQGGKHAAVIKDRGHAARDALEAIAERGEPASEGSDG